jgi:hypothetical protein
MSTWSVSMFASDRAHAPRHPLVPSTDGVLLEPGRGPCGPCASSEVLLDLAALSEGNLSAAGRRRLTAHLARCRPCRLVLAALDGEPRGSEPRAPDDPRGTGLVAHSP